MQETCGCQALPRRHCDLCYAKGRVFLACSLGCLGAHQLTHGELFSGAERARAYERSHAEWCDLILADLRRVHPDIDSLVQRIDVWVWGHGMIRPTPGVIWGEARRRMAEPMGPIHFAHSDQSGFSIFEEAYTRGVQAAAAVAAQLKPA